MCMKERRKGRRKEGGREGKIRERKWTEMVEGLEVKEGRGRGNRHGKGREGKRN